MIIGQFKGKYDFLSNFYPSTVSAHSHDYLTVEHFYQAHKFWYLSNEHQDVRLARSAAEAKARANKTHKNSRPPQGEWDKVKVGVMLAGLRLKFRIPELRQKLTATGDAILIEGNVWGDRFWGKCPPLGKTLTTPPDEWQGHNMLGVLLMIVRGEGAYHQAFGVPVLTKLWDPLP